MTPKTKTQAGFFRSIWIIVASVFYIAQTSVASIWRGLSGTMTRQWVDQALNRWLKRMFKLLRITCTVHNPHQVEPRPGQATIIMANHSSLFDIPVGLTAFPNHHIRMLAKKEMFKIPLMSRGMRQAEFPMIDRKNRMQAIRDLKHVEHLLKSGIVMWIFPEGTRSHDGHVAPLKKGGFITAIQTQATIIPLGIRGAFDILPARTLRFNLGQHAEVHIGQPIDASAYTLENKEELIQKVHAALCELAGDTEHRE
jgi:1-acyl-sn-glycerol-3-phosphate acyltransferase